jgi:hypothetical protein
MTARRVGGETAEDLDKDLRAIPRRIPGGGLVAIKASIHYRYNNKQYWEQNKRFCV